MALAPSASRAEHRAMRWVAAWFVFAGIVAFIIGIVQLQGAHDDWIVPTFCLIAVVAVLTAAGLLLRWPAARGMGLLVSLAGILGGVVILVAFVPILDVLEGGWLLLSPVIAWTLIFIACGWVLARSMVAPR
jgi:hypothetical protein